MYHSIAPTPVSHDLGYHIRYSLLNWDDSQGIHNSPHDGPRVLTYAKSHPLILIISIQVIRQAVSSLVSGLFLISLVRPIVCVATDVYKWSWYSIRLERPESLTVGLDIRIRMPHNLARVIMSPCQKYTTSPKVNRFRRCPDRALSFFEEDSSLVLTWKMTWTLLRQIMRYLHAHISTIAILYSPLHLYKS